MVSAHKLGENAFKPTTVGSYFNAHENHNETFKIIEDAISQSGANVSKTIWNKIVESKISVIYWTANRCGLVLRG